MVFPPERLVQYACPVTGPDGSVGYDRPLENYFDVSFADRLAPSRYPDSLYVAIANAHDDQYEPNLETLDNERRNDGNNHPLNIPCRKRRREVAKVPSNSPDYMGISPDVPGWRPRRSSYEDKRGRILVQPGEVNTVIPYIPLVDTSMPPLSRECFDAKSMTPEEPNEGSGDEEDGPDEDDEDEIDWGYETDGTVHQPGAVTSQSRQSTPPPTVPDSELDSDDLDVSDSDSDSDHDSDDQYDWHNVPDPLFSPRSLADPPTFLIPRRKPSVVISDDGDILVDGQGHTAPLSLEQNAVVPGPASKQTSTKRKRRSTAPPGRSTKKQKQMKEGSVIKTRRSVSPHHEPPLCDAGRPRSVPLMACIQNTLCGPEATTRASTADPPVPKQNQAYTMHAKQTTYPCLLDGCTHVCSSAGDLMRHQQSLKHRAPEYPCGGCRHAFTRPDALKRHLNNKPACKKAHQSKATEMEAH